jgi:hypothetical protein
MRSGSFDGSGCPVRIRFSSTGDLSPVVEVLIVVAILALTLWAGLSLLKETDVYDEVVSGLQDEIVHWASWALALIAVFAIAAVVYILLV